MRQRLNPGRWLLIAVVFVLTTATLPAQQAATQKKPAAAPAVAAQKPPAPQPVVQKRPISYDAYDAWRSIQGTRISRDGTWLAYALVAEDGDGELVVRNLRTNAEIRKPRGTSPVITVDGRFVVYTIVPVKAEVDKAKKDKKKPEEMPKPAVGIINLATGEATSVERVKTWKVPEESGRFVAYVMEAPEKKADAKPEPAAQAKSEEKAATAPKKKEKKKDPGTELIVRELGTANQTSVSEVVEYVWNKDGSWLAYSVSSTPKTPENDGAFARRPGEGTFRTLLAGNGNYKGLAFDDKDAQLAFVSDRDGYKADTPAFKLYCWSTTADAAAELASATTPGMPAGSTVSENGRPEFSKDGERLFLGTAPIPKPELDDAPEPMKVDIWHWNDPLLQPMQKVRADEDRKRNYRAVIHLKDKQFVQLETPDVPTLSLSEDSAHAIALSDVPYQKAESWDSSYSDLYSLNLQDGSRRKLVEQTRFGSSLSPGGGWAIYFDYKDNNWYSVRPADAKVTNLTAKLGVHFEDESSDTPEPPRAFGNAGWTDGDRTLLLYDKYDVWEVAPDGSSARNLTNGAGRKQHLVFRAQRLDPEERTFKTDQPLLLSATDDVTKATGYYRTSFAGRADPSKVVMLDKAVGSLIKAKNADTLVFTVQRFEEFPNLWVSDGNFTNMKRVSDANPQQAEYVWGRSELIDYVNADGRPLRAILTKPENFDASKKYPMMVYIYEQLTAGVHRFVSPAPGSSSINVTRYVSNGYIVLQPDIVYHTGYPGEDAAKCVIPAVQKVLSLGYVDPKRVGIQGHSWGGYQITYLVTRTDMFHAVEAGASVSDMISAYGGIRWGTGMSRAFQYEKTQSRIGAPPWKAPLQFIENSPIFWVEKVNTPYLTMHNDDDDAVPWYQGIEFFSALRRLGKEAYMFVYNGEKHGLRDRENMKHWTVHMDEYFDYFLKGAPRPEWMEKGVPYLDKGKRDVTPLYKPAAVKKTDGGE
jgi:dipeptidyl aminopeptidase/acylaminoacyl peptidase